MGMAVDDSVAAREARHQTLTPPDHRTRDMDHPDARALDLDHPPFRQCLAQGGLVHVARHRLDSTEALQLLEDGKADEIARVEDQLGLLQSSQAPDRQPTRSARHVGVSDDRDRDQPRPSRNRPSRYTSSPSA
jgi:hypothetical protein